jgi:hypothetical protein
LKFSWTTGLSDLVAVLARGEQTAAPRRVGRHEPDLPRPGPTIGPRPEAGGAPVDVEQVRFARALSLADMRSPPVSRLDEVGELDGWRCWVCDEPVDGSMSVNDPRGPSVDSVVSKAKARSKGKAQERLAHRSCNSRKGAVAVVVPWPDDLFVVDPVPILGSVERLERKGGREVVARCPTRTDGDDAAAWLVDRISRLRPDLDVSAEVEPGGGQFLLVLRA